MLTQQQFIELNPCPEAVEWALKQPSLAIAWEICERSDWMWWLMTRLRVDKNTAKQYARWCANSCKHLKSDAADATSNVDAAADAAADAADAADAAAYATDAYAAYAAYATAAHAADAAHAAAYTADATSNASNAANVAYVTTHKKQADFLRTIFPNPFFVVPKP